MIVSLSQEFTTTTTNQRWSFMFLIHPRYYNINKTGWVGYRVSLKKRSITLPYLSSPTFKNCFVGLLKFSNIV